MDHPLKNEQALEVVKGFLDSAVNKPLVYARQKVTNEDWNKLEMDKL